MIIETTREIAVEPSQVWSLLAERFADVGEWSAGVAESSLEGDLGTGGVRTCVLAAGDLGPGGTVTEKITKFDTGGHALTYEVTSGMPGMVSFLDNAWVVEPVGSSGSRVTSRVDLQLAWWARPMTPLVAKKFGSALNGFADELQKTLES